jgi:acetoin utilization deacetylase AcuC-like enzyme
MLAFCTSPAFVEHDTGPQHPERPDRIRAVAHAVRQTGLIESPNPFPDFEPGFRIPKLPGVKLLEIEPVPAEMSQIERVHERAMIEKTRRICQAGGGVLDQGDTIVSPRSFEIALLSCGAVLTCCDAVIAGKAKRAMAAGRPPGHHAEPDRAMGFCLLSNVAIAARHLQRQHGIGKLAIVDFDVHHGNGTQAAFVEDPSVLFISIHQHPRTCYPGTGYEWEKGEGPGAGTTLNIPMMPGGGDAQYLAEFHGKILPALDHFKPEILLISAGFDAHTDDPLANMEVTDEGFASMTSLLVQSANIHCSGRIISALEGGYNLAALGRNIVQHLQALRA